MANKPQGVSPSGDDEGIVLQSAGDADISRWLINLDLASKMIFSNDDSAIMDGLQFANVCWMESPPPIRDELCKEAPSIEVMRIYNNRRYPSEWSFMTLGLGDDRYIYRLKGWEKGKYEHLRYLAIIRKYWSSWIVNARKIANTYGMLYFKGEAKISVNDFEKDEGEDPDEDIWDPDK